MLFVELVLLGAAIERNRPPHGVAEIELPFDAVRPGRGVRVFEVGHEDVRAGVERVDDHLPIDGAGDLDAAIEQVGRNRRDRPVALADLARLGEEIGKLAGIEPRLPFLTRAKKPLAPRIELLVQRGHEP